MGAQVRRKLKILQVSGGAGFGGHTYVLLELTRRLLNEGCEVVVNTSDSATIRELEKLNVRTIAIQEMQRKINPYRDLVSLIRLVIVMRRERFDIVHTHTSKGGFLGRIAAKMVGVPVIIHHVHGFPYEGPEWGVFMRVVLWTAERFASLFQDQLIFVSEEDKKIAEKKGIVRRGRRVVVITNGVDFRRLQRSIDWESQGRLERNEREPMAGFFARLTEQKAPHLFLKAAGIVHHRLPSVKFLVVGDGPLRAEMEALCAEMHLQNVVEFLGFRRDVPELLNIVDVFVMPSLWEGLPIGLLEAMAMAKAVVATNVRGIREIIEHGKTGFLVPPNDPESLAQAVFDLLGNRERARRMGLAAQDLVMNRFNIERTLDEFVSVYRDLIQTRLDRKMNPIEVSVKAENSRWSASKSPHKAPKIVDS